MSVFDNVFIADFGKMLLY